MASYRIKIKIGEHEFEAEGEPEIVQAQFNVFKEIISSIPIQKPTSSSQDRQETIGIQQLTTHEESVSYEKMYKVDNRVVSLTALPGNVLEAVLLTLFGQKTFRNNDAITGAEIKDGLTQSGYRVDRVDKFLDKLAQDGLVIKIGVGKASRYRLTNQGMARAQTLAKDVLATIP